MARASQLPAIATHLPYEDHKYLSYIFYDVQFFEHVKQVDFSVLKKVNKKRKEDFAG